MNGDRQKSFNAELETISRDFSKIIWGTEKLKKADKIYSLFRIPAKERIVAYIKNSISFMGPAIVITDCALYSHSHEVFPISEICQYIVAQTDEKAAVTFSNAESVHSITGNTVLAKNVAGIELVQLIRRLQQELLKNYTWAKQQRDVMANKLMAVAREEMRIGRVSKKYMSLLDMLSAEKSYCDAVVMLKAEGIFRACDFEGYQNFLNSMPSNVTDETRSALRNSQEKFAHTLLEDLENLSLEFNQDFLNQIYSALSQVTALSNVQSLILACACVRLDKKEFFATIKEQVRRRMGNTEVQSLDFFRGCYCNARMRTVYEMIRNGALPPSECLEWTDSLGLSALHYAIILRQETLVEQMLEKRFCGTTSAVPNDEIVLLYDYTVLACYAELSNRNLVFQRTSHIAMAQIRSRKALEQRLWLKRRKLDIQNAAIQKAQRVIRQARENKQREIEYEYRIKLEELVGRKKETLLEIDEIQQAIVDVDIEIRELTESAMNSATVSIRRLKKSADPLLQYIFRLYSNVDLIYQVLSASPAQLRLYDYCGFTFVAISEIDLPCWSPVGESRDKNKEKRQEQKREQKKATDEPIVKPYGASWFSPQAHMDVKKLKEEYRTLAKKYHPDVSVHIRSQETFQDIVNERADILERMKD